MDSSTGDSAASLYAIVGVVGAALVTAVGGVLTAVLGRRRENEDRRIDANPNDAAFMAQAYNDLRADLDFERVRVSKLEEELEEARDLNEMLLRNVQKP